MEDDFGLSTEGRLVSNSDDPDMLKYAHTRSNRASSERSTKSRSTTGNRGQEKSEGQNINVERSPGDGIPLPQRFAVKYLGVRDTTNLWGIKHTRGPVDEMVSEAKRKLSTTNNTLPLLSLEVTQDGVTVGPMPQNVNPNFPVGRFPIESISYGVQDLVYTRVFAMIVVKPSVKVDGNADLMPKLSELDRDKDGTVPFRCHAFVTDKKETAKNLTFALAEAFQKFSQKVSSGKVKSNTNKIAINLRSGQVVNAGELDSSEA